MSTAETEPLETAAVKPALAPLRTRLLSAGLWSFLGRFIAIGLFFLTDMVLARALSKAQFAAFFLMTQATLFLGAVASLGTPLILSRSIRQTLHSEHPERTAAVIRRCTELLAFGCVAAGIGFYILAPWLAGDGAQWAPFRDNRLGIILWACLASACLNGAFTLQALDDFRMATFVASRRGGILPNVLFLVFTIVAWQFNFISMTALITAQIVFQAGTYLVAWLAVQRQLNRLIPQASVPSEAPIDAAADKSHFWYLVEGLTVLVATLLTMAMDELDGLWVGQFVSEAATADYGAAKRLVRLMTVPYVMFGLSLYPFVAELLVKNEIKRLQRILRATATIVSIPMLAVFTAYIVAPGWILSLAFGSAFREAAPILLWLAVGQCIIVLLGHGATVMVMAGRQKALMFVSLATLAIYAAALVPMVRSFGVTGAAALQTLVLVGQNLAVTLLAHRHVGVWTVATLRPSDVFAAVRALRGRGGRPSEPTTIASDA